MMSNHMKAARIHAYGDGQQLRIEQTPLPQLQENDVLVKVKSAAVNPVDWKIREGYLQEMLHHELPLTLGWDFSGEITALGEGVSQWQVGDAVYARPNITRNGSYAEYIAVDATEIAAKPSSLNWNEAAAVPLVTLTAWQCLYDAAELQAGQKVLIHAGSGGVGIAAIQLAKLRGAEVFTTTSTKNIDFVKSLGADTVIDYTQQSVAELRDKDVVFDTLGGDAKAQSWQTLKPGGVLVSIVEGEDPETAQQYGVRSAFCFVQPNAEQLQHIAALIDSGKLRAVIDSVYPLEKVSDALMRSESHRARGKIIVEIA